MTEDLLIDGVAPMSHRPGAHAYWVLDDLGDEQLTIKRAGGAFTVSPELILPRHGIDFATRYSFYPLLPESRLRHATFDDAYAAAVELHADQWGLDWDAETRGLLAIVRVELAEHEAELFARLQEVDARKGTSDPEELRYEVERAHRLVNEWRRDLRTLIVLGAWGSLSNNAREFVRHQFREWHATPEELLRAARQTDSPAPTDDVERGDPGDLCIAGIAADTAEPGSFVWRFGDAQLCVTRGADGAFYFSAEIPAPDLGVDGMPDWYGHLPAMQRRHATLAAAVDTARAAYPLLTEQSVRDELRDGLPQMVDTLAQYEADLARFRQELADNSDFPDERGERVKRASLGAFDWRIRVRGAAVRLAWDSLTEDARGLIRRLFVDWQASPEELIETARQVASI